MKTIPTSRILIAVTGASGSVYAERLTQLLLEKTERIYLLASDAGKKVATHELSPRTDEFSLLKALSGEIATEHKQILRVCSNEDLFSPIASGSSAPTAMIIVPCSMGTLARIATGISGNLIERAADVVIKQRRRLIICPRETPLSAIHLRNMTTLAELGADIVPAMPAFYQHPKSIDDMVDFVVGRILEVLGEDHQLYPRWNSRMI